MTTHVSAWFGRDASPPTSGVSPIFEGGRTEVRGLRFPVIAHAPHNRGHALVSGVDHQWLPLPPTSAFAHPTPTGTPRFGSPSAWRRAISKPLDRDAKGRHLRLALAAVMPQERRSRSEHVASFGDEPPFPRAQSKVSCAGCDVDSGSQCPIWPAQGPALRKSHRGSPVRA